MPRKVSPKANPAARCALERGGHKDWAAAFLGALVETGVVGRAAAAVGIDRRTVWVRRQIDAEFARAYEEALGAAASLLEDEAVRRAREGVRRLKFNTKTGLPYTDPATGEPYVEHEYSDALLLALLKAHLPERYRDRREIEHSGMVDGNFAVLTEERRRELMERRKVALAKGEGGRGGGE